MPGKPGTRWRVFSPSGFSEVEGETGIRRGSAEQKVSISWSVCAPRPTMLQEDPTCITI